MNGKELRIVYRNWKGEVGIRRIVPTGIRFAATEYHPEPQWMIDAYDVDKRADRTFAVRDILDCDPADDDQPVTADFVQSFGWEPDADKPRMQFGHMRVVYEHDYLPTLWCDDGRWEDHDCHEFKTRGQIRHLALAYGWEEQK